MIKNQSRRILAYEMYFSEFITVLAFAPLLCSSVVALLNNQSISTTNYIEISVVV